LVSRRLLRAPALFFRQPDRIRPGGVLGALAAAAFFLELGFDVIDGLPDGP